MSADGYQVEYASEKQNQLVRLADMLLRTFVLRKRVHYVLIDTYSTSGFWFAFLVSQLCRMLNLNYIPILHGGNLPHRLDRNPTLAKMLFKYSFKNVAPSNYLKHEFEKRGFNDVLFIPNVLELDNYTFKERKTIAPKLLWVRAFASIYNPKMAIRVFQEIQSSYPNAQLCMVGPDKDGSGEEIKKYAAEQNLNVQFTGRLEKEEWIGLSSQYDLFINTTHLDNTPVSVMEAMALGLPVVSTNVGGIPFLVKDNEEALLIKDNDVQGMVKAIEYLIMHPEVSQRLANNARRKAESWDWEVVKEEWKGLLVVSS